MSEGATEASGRERRTDRRIQVHLPLEVRGTDRTGARFEERTKSENICRSGLAFVLSRELDLGVDLQIQIVQSLPGKERFATSGRVRHIETNESRRVIGIQFTGPRFQHVFNSESSQPN